MVPAPKNGSLGPLTMLVLPLLAVGLFLWRFGPHIASNVFHVIISPVGIIAIAVILGFAFLYRKIAGPARVR